MPFKQILDRLLTLGERMRWEASLAHHMRDVERNADVAREGAAPDALHVVLDGWLQEYKQLPDGRRQILGLLLPGQICDLDLFTVTRRDSTLASVGPATIAQIGRADAAELLRTSPSLRQVFCWSEIVSAGIKRQWMASLGQRDAIERVAHLMCELYVRLHAGRSQGELDFLLTQAQVADATGLTPVHVNRIVQRLRRNANIDLVGRRLHVPDFDKLASIASFDPGYLHLGEVEEAEARAAMLFGAADEATRLPPNAINPSRESASRPSRGQRAEFDHPGWTPTASP